MTAVNKDIVYGQRMKYVNNEVADFFLAPGFSICYECFYDKCVYCMENTIFFYGLGNGIFNKKTLEENNCFRCPECAKPLGITGAVYNSCSFQWMAFTNYSQLVSESIDLYNGESCSVPFNELNINLETWNTVVEPMTNIDVNKIMINEDPLFFEYKEEI